MAISKYRLSDLESYIKNVTNELLPLENLVNTESEKTLFVKDITDTDTVNGKSLEFSFDKNEIANYYKRYVTDTMRKIMTQLGNIKKNSKYQREYQKINEWIYLLGKEQIEMDILKNILYRDNTNLCNDNDDSAYIIFRRISNDILFIFPDIANQIMIPNSIKRLLDEFSLTDIHKMTILIEKIFCIYR